MIDIERKTYKLIEENIDSLDKVLLDYGYIVDNVFKNNEQVEWSKADTLNSYIKLAIKLLKEEKLFDVLCVLKSIPNADTIYNVDIVLFYSLLERLLNFLKRVFDLFLLDQFLYILLYLPLEDFTFEKLSKPLKTGSYYEQNFFELDYFQTGLDSSQSLDGYDQKIYFIKEDYLRKIRELLKKDFYRNKKETLEKAMLAILAEHEDSLYMEAMSLGFEALIPNVRIRTSKTPEVFLDPNQTSLFKR